LTEWFGVPNAIFAYLTSNLYLDIVEVNGDNLKGNPGGYGAVIADVAVFCAVSMGDTSNSPRKSKCKCEQ